MMSRLIPILLLALTGCDRSPPSPRCMELPSAEERAWVLECIKADSAPAGFDDAVMCQVSALELFRGCR